MRRRLSVACSILVAAGATGGCGGDPPTTLPVDVASILFDYPEVVGELKNFLVPGEVLQLAAHPINSAGDTVGHAALTWTSSNEAVLDVSPTGQITAHAVGEASITVEAGDAAATLGFVVFPGVASLEILPPSIGLVPGGIAEIQVVLRDAANQILPHRVLSLHGGSNAAGLFGEFGVVAVHAMSPGTATAEVRREEKSDVIEITVATVQFDTVDAAGGRGCGLTGEGAAWCWGTNSTGALGYGVEAAASIERSGWTPVRVAGGHAFSQISVGNSHTCALTLDGTAWCWGNNQTGALGVSGIELAAAPVPVSGGIRFAQISASYAYTCGVTTAGAAYCWGNNDVGQLGDGTTIRQFAPVPVAGGLTFSRVSARWAEQFAATTCGLTVSGAAYCWGGNAQGQTGNGGAELEYHSPVQVAGGHTFVDLSAGGSHSCGVDAAGDAWCWGSYGDRNTILDLVPGGLQWRSISVRAEHSCGVTTSNAAYCWGFNATGQLGDGTRADSGMNPVPVAGGLTFESIAPAQGYTCGLTLPGGAYCWGEGTSGQLGQNTLDNHSTPMRVVGQP